MSLDNILNRTFDLYKFDPKTSISSLASKVIVVTGGNAGLGYQSIVQLAPHSPSKIYLTARTRAKFDAAIIDLKKDDPEINTNLIHFVQMDLSSLASVKTAAEQILSDTDRIDILMNNAGVMGASPAVTKEGFEIHFGTNHIGHALFTKILLPVLLRTASQPGADVRIVNVSSGAYQMGGTWDEKAIKTPMTSALMPRYGASKLANVLHARGLAKHYPSITSVSIAPGRVKTGLLDGMYASGSNRFYGYFQSFYDVAVGAKSPYEGAYTQVWAACETDQSRIENGAIYFPVGKKDPGTAATTDAEVDRLWAFTEDELKKLGY